METIIKFTDSSNFDFLELATLLEEYLNTLYGDIKQYYQFNKLYFLDKVVIIYSNDEAIACGALTEYDGKTIELKRIFVKEEYRGQGLSKQIVKELEKYGQEYGYKEVLLETGSQQKPSISLFETLGYNPIDNFEPYTGNANSVCMHKHLPKL